MEVDKFISNMKADGSEKDVCDLGKSYNEYMGIIKKLSLKDKSSFSLHVLWILYRNLDKVPSWRDKIDDKELLTLSVECLRHTRGFNNSDQVKTLASTFHIHRHVISKNSTPPPELVIKLSYTPFEYDNLLKEYYKTYSHFVIDRIVYIEKLKLEKMNISKLLPKLTEHVIKVIDIYDTVQFCTQMLTSLIKRLYFVYNDSPNDINVAFAKIFENISTRDLKKFGDLSEKEEFDLYNKLNECLCAVAENSLKTNFTDSVLDSVIQVSISLLGHRSDMFHCFQTIWNPFSLVLNEKTTTKEVENLLNGLLSSCKTNKLEYKSAINITSPYISQVLRLFIENNVNSKQSDDIVDTVQEYCFKLVLLLLDELKTAKQLTKCENCHSQTGIHDALRLTFSLKPFMSTNQESSATNLQLYCTIVEQQYAVLSELKTLKCPNQGKYFRKLQTDVHNVAVLLNKQKQFEFSLKLFNIYINSELKNIKNDADIKNITRALYNKGICEQDSKQYKQSLQSAYLSLVFSLPEGLNTDKHLSLVIDIKSKALNGAADDDVNENNDLQALSVLEVCGVVYKDKCYEDYRMFLKNLKFSSLLLHEFSMYVKLWPSAVPISGVWIDLFKLLTAKNGWIKAEDPETVLWTLYQVVLETPTAVRTIHNETFKTIVGELVKRFQESPPSSVQNKIIYAAILLLKSEYDINQASEEYGWKVNEHTINPDLDTTFQTLKQEYIAAESAIQAVEMFTEAVQELESGILANTMLSHITQIMCVSVQQLLHFEMIPSALQLAYVGCLISDVAGDKLSYVRNAGVLINHSEPRKELQHIVTRGTKCAAELMKIERTLDAALCFMCDMAIYYIKSKSVSVASRLVRAVQTKVFQTLALNREVYMELSAGRLMYAQAMLSPGSAHSTLSVASGLHRYYLAARNTETRWALRRYISLSIKNAIVSHGTGSVRIACGLLLRRRARSAAATALPPAAAAASARLHALITDVHGNGGTQTDVTTRLKYILGQENSKDALSIPTSDVKEQLTPKRNHVETMLDSMIRTVPISPSLPQSVPVFRTQDFLKHAKTCTCYACSIPGSVIIACQISYLDASAYYRSQEFDIARNYFNGGLKTFEIADAKLKAMFERCRFDNTVIDIARKLVYDEFKTVQLEFLIEIAYFELSEREFEKADDHIVALHEILAEFPNVDPYLQNEISNVMIVAAKVRKAKVPETGLEREMEELKLSPNAVLKTPETKRVPYVETVKVVAEEELPQRKFVGVKFDLDKNEDEDLKVEKPEPKFKVPEPIISKPVLDPITPRVTRSTPSIIITRPEDKDDEVFTPQTTKNVEFFTPSGSTPAQEFFTPMTTLKSYTKRRIVKKLENEFLTPKGKGMKEDLNTQVSDFQNSDLGTQNTENFDTKDLDAEGKKKVLSSRTRSRVETGSMKTLKDKRSLKRATSPGKLMETKTVARRVRQPVFAEKK